MKHKEYITTIVASFIAFLCGELFISFKAGWLIVRYPSYRYDIAQQKATMLVKRTPITFHFYRPLSQTTIVLYWLASFNTILYCPQCSTFCVFADLETREIFIAWMRAPIKILCEYPHLTPGAKRVIIFFSLERHYSGFHLRSPHHIKKMWESRLSYLKSPHLEHFRHESPSPSVWGSSTPPHPCFFISGHIIKGLCLI